jgi:hypothetical protein
MPKEAKVKKEVKEEPNTDEEETESEVNKDGYSSEETVPKAYSHSTKKKKEEDPALKQMENELKRKTAEKRKVDEEAKKKKKEEKRQEKYEQKRTMELMASTIAELQKEKIQRERLKEERDRGIAMINQQITKATPEERIGFFGAAGKPYETKNEMERGRRQTKYEMSPIRHVPIGPQPPLPSSSSASSTAAATTSDIDRAFDSLYSAQADLERAVRLLKREREQQMSEKRKGKH